MQKVTDSLGREIQLNLTLGRVQLIEQELGIRLYDVDQPVPDDVPTLLPKTANGQPTPLAVMIQLDLSLAATLAFHMQSTLDDYQSFANGLDAAAGVRMREAVCTELIDFFRQCGWSAPATIIEKAKTLATQANSLATELIGEQLDKLNLDQAKATIRAQLANASGATSGGSPASPA